MSSDPGDPDDEAAALRARLDRLSGELKGRAAPPSTPGQKPEPKASPGRLCDVAWLAGWQRVRLGGHYRLRHWLGSRPGAPHQSCVSDCIFLDRRCRGDLERDPADFAKTVSLKRNSPLSRANSPDKDVRRSASRAEPDASLGGRGAAGGALQALQRGGRRRGRGRGDRVGTGDQSDPPICPAPCRFDSGRGSRRLADQFRALHVAGGRAHLPFGCDRRARRFRRAGTPAGHGRNVLRVRRRHGALLRRRGGNAVFPVGLLHLLFRLC